MNLRQWSEQLVGVVDQDGGGVKRIRLLGPDGSTWHTWDREALTPSWPSDAEDYLNAMLDDWPTVKVSVMFVAEDAAGNVRSQLPKSVMGKNRATTKQGFFGGDKSISDMVEAVSRTAQRMLDTANGQLANQGETIKTLMEQNRLLLELVQGEREARALSDGWEGKVLEMIGPHVGPIAEALPDLIRAFAPKPQPKPPRLNGLPASKVGN
jgi:hypothetical protein